MNPHELTLYGYYLYCPDTIVVKLILEVNENMVGIVVSNVDPSTKVSLLNKDHSNQVHFRHCSTKFPNQCIFAVHFKFMHINIISSFHVLWSV